jgi:membrane fusion protein (multidrug efflux system)
MADDKTHTESTGNDHDRAALDHRQAELDHAQFLKAQEEKDKKKAEEQKRQRPLWPWLVGGAVVLVFILVVLYIVLAPHRHQKTDDAYVSAHYSLVAPRVGGQVAEILVNDNQAVHAGQLLLVLDDRDFQSSLAQARAALASDQARVAQADTQIERQPAMIAQSMAQVASARARLELSVSNARRYDNLAATGAGTVQARQQSAVTLRQDQASLASAEADLRAARLQLDALHAERDAAQARVTVDAAQVAQAELNLSYTRITAPIAGTIDQRSVQIGNFVSPGSAVMAVVPLDDIFVLANYREIALHHMRPGQPVLIHVDAYGIDLNGIIDSVPPSSGAAYSPIPPNNATGNFTKIVQRFPVKILFAPNQRLVRLVRVGMSVETTVDTSLDDVVGAQSARDVRVTGREQ